MAFVSSASKPPRLSDLFDYQLGFNLTDRHDRRAAGVAEASFSRRWRRRLWRRPSRSSKRSRGRVVATPDGSRPLRPTMITSAPAPGGSPLASHGKTTTRSTAYAKEIGVVAAQRRRNGELVMLESPGTRGRPCRSRIISMTFKDVFQLHGAGTTGRSCSGRSCRDRSSSASWSIRAVRRDGGLRRHRLTGRAKWSGPAAR